MCVLGTLVFLDMVSDVADLVDVRGRETYFEDLLRHLALSRGRRERCSWIGVVGLVAIGLQQGHGIHVRGQAENVVCWDS